MMKRLTTFAVWLALDVCLLVLWLASDVAWAKAIFLSVEWTFAVAVLAAVAGLCICELFLSDVPDAEDRASILQERDGALTTVVKFLRCFAVAVLMLHVGHVWLAVAMVAAKLALALYVQHLSEAHA